MTLVCTYRRGEGRRRSVFDVLIDGQKIASETLAYHPDELYDVEYAIPENLTVGKARVIVQFQPQPDSIAVAVFHIRIVSHVGTTAKD